MPDRPIGNSGAAYTAVADQLAREIEQLPPNSRVISEHGLIERFRVSRTTARAALQEVEQRQLVRRVRGAGTFVALRLDYRIASDVAPSWSASIRSLGHVPSVVVDELGVALATPPDADDLGVEIGSPLVTIKRRGFVDSIPAMSAHHQLPADLGRDLAGHLGASASIHDSLCSLGFTPVRLWTRAQLQVVPEPVAEDLELHGRPLAWLVESVNTCASSGRHLEATRSWMRADVFRLRFELGATRLETSR